MDRIKLGFLAGGAALTIGGVFAYFMLKDAPKQKESSKCRISKSVVFSISKELKNHMFSISLQILEKRIGIQKQLEMGASLSPETSFEEYVREIGNSMFSQIRKLLCAKFEVSVDDYLNAIEYHYGNEKEISEILEDIQEMLANAIQGIGPNMDIDQNILDLIPSQKLYNLHVKFFRLASKKYIKVFQEMKEEGEIEISLENPIFLQKNKELRIPETKRELLLREGFDQFPQSPRQTFDRLTYKYRQEDQEFNDNLQKIENSFSGLIDKLADNPFLYNEQSPDLIFQEY